MTGGAVRENGGRECQADVSGFRGAETVVPLSVRDRGALCIPVCGVMRGCKDGNTPFVCTAREATNAVTLSACPLPTAANQEKEIPLSSEAGPTTSIGVPLSEAIR